MLDMSRLPTPIICVVIGEGGSGGALGIGVADRVMILENAYYSVISPEACSAILWKDRRHAPEAAEALKLTADDLIRLGVVDEVVPEPEGGAHRDHDLAAAHLGSALRRNLERLTALGVEELLTTRYDKFRKLGNFAEDNATAANKSNSSAG
jgi:acetyl-CoA carboxylase carboxyl transferase subunit alpha